MIRLLKNIFKWLIRWDRRKFNAITKGMQLSLDYKTNKDALKVLETVFVEKEYALYFPFYENAIVLDVGAHYGYFSFFAAMNLDQKSIIYSLEPDANNFSVFQQNHKANPFKNIRLFNCGLGKSSAVTNFYGTVSFNKTTIEAEGARPSSQVQLFTLSDFLQQQRITQVDFLKMDCEGAEYEILLNADQATLQKIKTISLEFHDLKRPDFSANRLVEFLASNGFEIAHFKYDVDRLYRNVNYGKIVAVSKL